MSKIMVIVGDIMIRAQLYDTPTAKAIEQILPIQGTVSTWGDEIYFSIPLEQKLEPDARQDMEIGELGYWPEGPAFCIFFGPTPVSTSGKPRAYSPVNVFGRVLEDPKSLESVQSDETIRVDLYHG
jgi:uncharacterized protein